jgi:hypothetical protein
MLQLRVLVGRDPARAVSKWKQFMDGKTEEYNVWHSRDHPDEPDMLPRRFKNSMPPEWKTLPNVLSAIQVHLQTRLYQDEDMRAGRIATVDMDELRQVPFKAWRTYTSSTDDGDQHYRCKKDATWGANLREAWVSSTRSLYYGDCAIHSIMKTEQFVICQYMIRS